MVELPTKARTISLKRLLVLALLYIAAVPVFCILSVIVLFGVNPYLGCSFALFIWPLMIYTGWQIFIKRK
jgi:hypothetical protein